MTHPSVGLLVQEMVGNVGGFRKNIDVRILLNQTSYFLYFFGPGNPFLDKCIRIGLYILDGGIVDARATGQQVVAIARQSRQGSQFRKAVEVRRPSIVFLVVAARAEQGRIFCTNRPQQTSGQRMIEIKISLAPSPVVQFAVALEAPAAEFFKDGLAVDSASIARQSFIEPTALCRFSMLVGDTRLILDPVVNSLAEATFALTAGTSRIVDVKQIERLPSTAQQAVLKSLGFTYIVVVKNNELSLLNRRLLRPMNQPVIE